eukprot:SAG31_NODE_5103_length_2742_cov_5.165721_3_plen_89_part_00
MAPSLPARGPIVDTGVGESLRAATVVFNRAKLPIDSLGCVKFNDVSRYRGFAGEIRGDLISLSMLALDVWGRAAGLDDPRGGCSLDGK